MEIGQKFATASYTRQAHFYEGEGSGILLSKRKANTIDHFRHDRQLSTLLPIIRAFPTAHWLTVGDGLYGGDAHFLYSNGANVLATDLSDTYLKPAKTEGYIPDYAIENCENLSFNDDSFDFALCKHAYHHFPRPMLALYELLRVARIGVLLIEPIDANLLCPQKLGLGMALRWAWVSAKNQVKQWLNKKPYYSYGVYESAGNYAYAIHEREIEKVALGLNYPAVAFLKLCDHYERNLESEPATLDNPKFIRYKKMLEKSEAKARNGNGEFNVLVSLIGKTELPHSLIATLAQNHWDYRQLSRNPYLYIESNVVGSEY